MLSDPTVLSNQPYLSNGNWKYVTVRNIVDTTEGGRQIGRSAAFTGEVLARNGATIFVVGSSATGKLGHIAWIAK